LCATIASSELSAAPICFAPLQRSTRCRTAQGTSPKGRGWSARSSAIDARFRHMNAVVAAGAPRETLPMAAEAGLRVIDALWAKTQMLWFVRIIVPIDGSQASPLPSPARGSLQPSAR
jgi:hypothetical protein